MSGDNSNSVPPSETNAAPVPVSSNAWRTPERRQRVVNKIMEHLKDHLPFSEQEGLLELKETAVSFEESSYTPTISHTDYLKEIANKMLAMIAKSQPPIVNAPQLNPVTDDQDPADQDSDDLGDPPSDDYFPDYQEFDNQEFDDPGLMERSLLHLQMLEQRGGIEPEQSIASRIRSRLMPQTDSDDSETSSWTFQYTVPPACRENIVNKIVETLKRLFPISGEEALIELREIVVHYEERIHSAVTSPTEYLRNISLKMLVLEEKTAPPMNAPLPDAGTSNEDPATILAKIRSLLM